jgi:hypothetical protein
VQVGELAPRLTENALMGHLLPQRRPGEKLTVPVTRGKERLILKPPQQ